MENTIKQEKIDDNTMSLENYHIKSGAIFYVKPNREFSIFCLLCNKEKCENLENLRDHLENCSMNPLNTFNFTTRNNSETITNESDNLSNITLIKQEPNENENDNNIKCGEVYYSRSSKLVSFACTLCITETFTIFDEFSTHALTHLHHDPLRGKDVKMDTENEIQTVFFQSKNLQIQNIIGFKDSDNNVIDNEILVNYLLSVEYNENPKNFIQLCCKKFHEAASQTDEVKRINSETQTSSEQQISALKRSSTILGPMMLVSSEDFKNYICERKGIKYIEEFENTNSLTDKSRKAIIDYLANYTEDNFGLYPSKDEKKAVCHACVNLFPILKTQNEELEGIDLLYDIKRGTGFFSAKLKNLRRCSGASTSKINILKEQNISSIVKIECIENFEDDLKFLQDAILPAQIDEVKVKLIKTFEIRRQIIKQKLTNINLQEEFSYFFVEPELISFEYDLINKKKVNFIENWKKIKRTIFEVVRESGKNILKTQVFDADEWNFDTLAFLNLIRLVPPLSGGSKKYSRVSDVNVVEKLIFFEKIGLPENDYSCPPSESPYLKAVGHKKSAIHQYLIAVDGAFIPLAKDITIAEAIQKLFEVHFVFDISFEKNLKPFWIFVQHYLFEVNATACLTPVILNANIKIQGYLKRQMEVNISK